MIKILKGIKYLFFTTLGLLILITFIGLINRFTNPGWKSISLVDLKHLGLGILINTVSLLLIIIIIFSKKRNQKSLRKF